MSWLLSFTIGGLTGVLSAFGIGGGTLLLIYMTTFANISQTTAQGINLLYFLPTAAIALISHRKNGFLRKEAAKPAILFGLIGTALTAWVATALDVALLRKVFGVFLIYIGVTELFRKKDK